MLNLAMQVLEVASELRAKGIDPNDTLLHNHLCLWVGDVPWDKFTVVLHDLEGSSSSSISPMQRVPGGYQLTRMGRLLLHAYQKIKAEIMAQEKYGPFADLFASIQDLLSYYSYGQYGLGVDFIFSNANNLKEAVRALRKEGEDLLQDENFYTKLDVIDGLVNQMIQIQKVQIKEESDLNVQQFIAITNGIVDAFKELRYLRRRRFRFEIGEGTIALIQDPFPEIASFIAVNLDEYHWGDLLAECSTGSVAVKYPMRLGAVHLTKALVAFLQDRTTIPVDPLPEGEPQEIRESAEDQLRVREEERKLLEEEMFEKLMQVQAGLDYDLARSSSPVSFCNRIFAVYKLALEGRAVLENSIKEVKDQEFDVDLFYARQVSQLLEGERDK